MQLVDRALDEQPTKRLARPGVGDRESGRVDQDRRRARRRRGGPRARRECLRRGAGRRRATRRARRSRDRDRPPACRVRGRGRARRPRARPRHSARRASAALSSFPRRSARRPRASADSPHPSPPRPAGSRGCAPGPGREAGASGWIGRSERSAASTIALEMSPATPARSSSSSTANASCDTVEMPGRLGGVPRCKVHSVVRDALLDDDRLGHRGHDGTGRGDGRHDGWLDRPDRPREVGERELLDGTRVGRRSVRGGRLPSTHLAERRRDERRALVVDRGRARARSAAARLPANAASVCSWVGTRSAASTSIDFVPKNPPTPPFNPWRWLRMTADGPSSSRICGASSSSERPT